MLPVLEKLLILQDRDRKIIHAQAELSGIGPQRQMLQDRLAANQKQMDLAKTQVKQLESDRKKLELDAEAKKSQSDKYAGQQLLTRKNEEYKALAHEIEMCKEAISQLDDQQLVIMEKSEAAQKELAVATKSINEARVIIEKQIADLSLREEVLKKELSDFQSGRAALTDGVDEAGLSKYERLLKSKGDKILVGITHGVCGGCHMRLPQQSIVSCQGDIEINTCPNCGRILYYTREMDVHLVD
ncbi:MAG TPA: C4-type zinc ribbon domain-containing protein [Roseimicrobium sp.]|nr:C4-type zinc ribbon domain-containing protein [Roseimicrobium sp.]